MRPSHAAALAIMWVFASSMAAAEDRLRLRPEDRHTVVIAEFETVTGSPPQAVQVMLSPQSADANLGDRLSGRTSGDLTCRPRAAAADTFAAYRILPGRMEINTAVISNVPTLLTFVCFRDMVQFDANAGEVVFIGRVSTDATRSEATPVEQGFVPTGQSTWLFAKAATDSLQITPPSELPGWEERVDAYIQAHHPRITAPVRAAELTIREGRCVVEQRDRYSWQRWEPLE